MLEQLKKSIDEYNTSGGGGGGSGLSEIKETEFSGEVGLTGRQQQEQAAAAAETPSTPPNMSFMPGGSSSAFLKTSPSIDFFMLYLSSNSNAATASCLSYLDKEWYYNIVNSACSYSSGSGGAGTTGGCSSSDLAIADQSSLLKSKQCALMLSNLDFSNIMSILSSKSFRLSILRECVLLGAHRTQVDILKLPEVLRQAATSGANLSLQNDFMHPLWVASSQCLFNLLKELAPKLPEPPLLVTSNLTEYKKIYLINFFVFKQIN